LAIFFLTRVWIGTSETTSVPKYKYILGNESQVYGRGEAGISTMFLDLS
jgi:hypothetical protein